MGPSRSKKRRSLETQCDLISDLPKDVLYRIMECLPVRDAAQMSLLSHKWQDIWTSTPHLVFDVPFFMSLNKQVHETQRYYDIVSKILLLHQGPILRFSMHVPPLDSIPDVAPWISYLSRNGLREFSLSNVSNQTNIRLSSRLFSCDGLEKLKLSRCRFSLPPNFRGFAKLTSLELDKVFLSHSIFKKLIANCLVLKKLVLTHCCGIEQMHIVIDAPKLQVLILGWTFKSLELKSCENLVSASIDITLANICHKASLCDLLKLLSSSSKLERLCLRGWFCRVLFKERSLHSTFERLRNLEFLSIQLDNLDSLSSLLSCMQSFSSIETLRICVRASCSLDKRVLDFYPDCTLHHLRCATVGISSGAGPELKLIEFLLACSPVLEKLTVLPAEQLNQGSRSKMLIQLNRFRRASQKVEVFCPEPRIPAGRVEVRPAAHVGVQPAAHVGVRPAASSSEDDSSDSSSTEDSYYSHSSSSSS